jgi:hypothetical protein
MRLVKKNKEKLQVNCLILIEKKEPKIGDLKEKIKFAFFPVSLDKTNIVWLENYREIYEYKSYFKCVTEKNKTSTSFDKKHLEIFTDWGIERKKIYRLG